MILYELFQDEQHPAYRQLAVDNLARQYGFLGSIVNAAITANRPMISTAVVAALNYHAISCLHVNAGAYRPCDVTVGDHSPPTHHRVPELMNAFINEVNRYWETTDVLSLASYCLWRLNHIHPFINGNGRTARALCYYVVCVKLGSLLGGDPILPDLIRRNRDEYVELLRATDAGFRERRPEPLDGLRAFISRLLAEQIGDAR
ncbi:MAG: Fic family protein [Acidobacteria bacterium]|nr:Fic family protein [Acidobacteriota bacterium]